MKTITVTLLILSFIIGNVNSKAHKTTQSRSAKTGRYVTKSYANNHKSTTVTSKRKK